jgi:hypothetical protein
LSDDSDLLPAENPFDDIDSNLNMSIDNCRSHDTTDTACMRVGLSKQSWLLHGCTLPDSIPKFHGTSDTPARTFLADDSDSSPADNLSDGIEYNLHT